MNNQEVKSSAVDGLWKNNPALVQLLGLCPLLAVSTHIVKAIALGLATTALLILSNTSVSLLRHHLTESIRLPTYILLIAAFTTCIELLMQAFTYELYISLGIFITLIMTNCSVLWRADAFASQHPVLPSALDGLMTGMGFTAVLVMLGALRELVGQGTLFADMPLLFGALFGDTAGSWTLHVSQDYPGFLLALLPPGAFIFMGLLIAAKNLFDQRRAARLPPSAAPVSVSRRVRTTGHIT